jgi:hypothetical protein
MESTSEALLNETTIYRSYGSECDLRGGERRDEEGDEGGGLRVGREGRGGGV